MGPKTVVSYGRLILSFLASGRHKPSYREAIERWMMKSCKVMAVLTGVLSIAVLIGTDRKAKTEDGKEVILRDDGTWVYADAVKKDKKDKKEGWNRRRSSRNQQMPSFNTRGREGRWQSTSYGVCGKRWRSRPAAAAEVGFRNKK